MRTTPVPRTTVTEHREGAEAAQRLFESLFPAGHKPKVDTRTPAQVAAR